MHQTARTHRVGGRADELFMQQVQVQMATNQVKSG